MVLEKWYLEGNLDVIQVEERYHKRSELGYAIPSKIVVEIQCKIHKNSQALFLEYKHGIYKNGGWEVPSFTRKEGEFITN